METTALYDRMLAPLTNALTPEVAQTLVGLQTTTELQAHVDDLAAKANEGTITAAEESEYKAIVDVADLLAIIKLRG